MSEQKSESEKKDFDKTTLNAAAIICLKQCLQHEGAMSDVVLKREAREAHKFVAINLNHVATTILMYATNGDFHLASRQALEIKQMLRAETKALREKKPDIKVVK